VARWRTSYRSPPAPRSEGIPVSPR
jgi:hypothetical protein